MTFLASIAWRNLWRHKRRSLITASAMAVALGMCMAAIAFTDGTYLQLFEVMVEQRLGHIQVNHPDYPRTKSIYDTIPTEMLDQVQRVPGVVAASERLKGYALVGGSKKSAGAQLIGINPLHESQTTPLTKLVISGDYLPNDAKHQLLIGDGLAEDIEVGVGDTVALLSQNSQGGLANDIFTISGLVHTGDAQVDKMGAYLHIHDMQEFIIRPGEIHSLMIITDESRELEEFTADIKEAYSTHFADRAVEVKTWREASPQTSQLMSLQTASTFIMVGLIFSVSAFGVLNTMLMSVFERTNELGVLKAIGMRPWRLIVLILWESIFLSAIACVLGLAFGGLLDAYLVVYGIDFSASLQEDITFAGVQFDPVFKGKVYPGSILFTVASLFVISIIASLWPAIRAARLEPVEAIRKE